MRRLRRKSTEEPTPRGAGLQISTPGGGLRLRDCATSGRSFRRFTDEQPIRLSNVREDTRDRNHRDIQESALLEHPAQLSTHPAVTVVVAYVCDDQPRDFFVRGVDRQRVSIRIYHYDVAAWASHTN